MVRVSPWKAEATPCVLATMVVRVCVAYGMYLSVIRPSVERSIPQGRGG